MKRFPDAADKPVKDRAAAGKTLGDAFVRGLLSAVTVLRQSERMVEARCGAALCAGRA